MGARAGQTRAGRTADAARGGARGTRERTSSARSGNEWPREQVTEIQRSRLVAAAVRTVEELGYADATVGRITARARVSRRTFYELFANREECLAEVLVYVVGLIESELAAVDLPGRAWRERVRLGLWTILSFFDREPVLARVCVVQSLQGGAVVIERREQILARLAAILDEGRLERGRGERTPLTAEALVGATLAVIHTRLSRASREPLRGLLGELMGMIVLPYQGPASARRELSRPAPNQSPGAHPAAVKFAPVGSDPLDGIAIRVTYRTAKVLEGVGASPGVSNRQVADYAGISDQGQVSKLLSRLERLGLLANQGAGHSKGEPNAWQLTSRGELVARSVGARVPREVRAA